MTVQVALVGVVLIASGVGAALAAGMVAVVAGRNKRILQRRTEEQARTKGMVWMLDDPTEELLEVDGATTRPYVDAFEFWEREMR